MASFVHCQFPETRKLPNILKTTINDCGGAFRRLESNQPLPLFETTYPGLASISRSTNAGMMPCICARSCNLYMAMETTDSVGGGNMSGFSRDFWRSNAAFVTSFTIHLLFILVLAFCFFSVPGLQTISLNGEADDMGQTVVFDFDNKEAEKAVTVAVAELNETTLTELEKSELSDVEWVPELESMIEDVSWMEHLNRGDKNFVDELLASDADPLLDSREVGFFGIEPSGSRVVYIIDMSVSMGYSGYFGPRYQRAVAEVLKSVEQLTSDQQFFVILFCFECYEMNIGQRNGQFVTPTDENKDRLTQWLSSVQLGGGTDPRVAIVRALERDPSCIFLLSDGEFNGNYFDNPPYRKKSSAVELAKQHNRNGCPIHTIGLEDKSNQRELTLISEQSGGKYQFVSGER